MADQKATEVTAQDLANLTAYKTVGSDKDLPANERRTRNAPLIDNAGNLLVLGDVVTDGVSKLTVLGHGRGIGWMLCASVQFGVKCIGTYPVGMLRKV